ncbi:MAG: hypothetical protein H6Q69_3757 [Firmicutes bacterium]|nr:hypothetical protein [Bacillota bacterium]
MKKIVFYNKRYLGNLLEKGFIPADEISQNELVLKGLYQPVNQITN